MPDNASGKSKINEMIKALGPVPYAGSRMLEALDPVLATLKNEVPSKSKINEMLEALDPEPRARFRAILQADRPVRHVGAQMIRRATSLPQRATEAAGHLQRTGEYDPGPGLETAMMLFGARSHFIKPGELGAAGGKLKWGK